jgi:hypothetical protein
MIEILPQSENERLGVVISGRLTHEDYQKLEPELDLRAGRFDAFDLLVELTDIEGVEPEAIRDDLEFTREYASNIGHMAVVTDDPLWQRLSQFLGKPLGELVGIDLEHFADRSAAWEWLQST